MLAFPCNQFGHQENSSGQEILNALKYVRPGNGFEPKCVMMDKVRTHKMRNIQLKFNRLLLLFQVVVNGESTHPVFEWLKSKMPLPRDDITSLMGDPKHIIWKPVQR